MGQALTSRLAGWPRSLRLAAAGVVVVMVVVAVGLTTGPDGSGGAPVDTGATRKAPTFSVPDLRDPAAKVELTAYAGRPVVLNFWASWCVPCRREMPAFQAVHRQLGDDVAFVGINHLDGRTPARDLLAETGVTYPSGHDPEGKVAAAYGLKGMPSTVFVSPSGQLLATRTGEMSRSELVETIEKLFG